MGHFTIPQLLRLIVGLAVVVCVSIGIYLFFRYNIDFFANFFSTDKDSDNIIIPGPENGEEEEEPLRLCEDCKGGIPSGCSKKQCAEINEELKSFDKRCSFIKGGWGWGPKNKCITLNI